MSDTSSFADRLASAVIQKKNAVCVGLDPRKQFLPADLKSRIRDIGISVASAYRMFCFEIIDVVAPLVPVVKPQAAFFEQQGPQGMQALGEVIRYAHDKGLLVIMDGKRNDIGTTAEAYASAYLGAGDRSPWGSDSLTVSPYLGDDSLEPFLRRSIEVDAGIFVLVKTSNPGSGTLQDRQVDGLSIAQQIANWVEIQSSQHKGNYGYGPVGAVVGATYPDELAQMRSRMPSAWILIPGYGAQGGSAQDVAAGFDSRGLGAIVNSSRGIIFANDTKRFAQIERWQSAVEAATKEMIQSLSEFVPTVVSV